jgi:acetyl esterase
VPLDAEARSLIDLAQATSPPVQTLTPEQARRASDERRERAAAPVQPIHDVSDLTIDTETGPLPVRVYRPASDAGMAAVVFFHGGGWVLCDLESHDGMCRALANATGAVFVSVGFRNAPEAPYPAGVEDCYAATAWVVAHADLLGIDRARVAVMGDSAGGNLAAAVALMARDRSGPALAAQVLAYPVMADDFDTRSYREYGAGEFYLTREAMQWYWDHYVPEERRHEPYAAPLRAAELAGLPAAVVLVGECDPLHDEGLAYATRLADSGVPCTVIDFEGGFHGFLSFAAVLDSGRRALSTLAAAVRAVLKIDEAATTADLLPR